MGADVKGSSLNNLDLESGSMSKCECFSLFVQQLSVTLTHWKSMLLTVTSNSSFICQLLRMHQVKEVLCLAAPFDVMLMSLLQRYQRVRFVMECRPMLVTTIIILVNYGASWLLTLQGEITPNSTLLSTSSSSFCLSRHRFNLILSSLASELKKGSKQSQVFLNQQNSSFSRFDYLLPRHSLGSLHSARSSLMRLVVTLVALLSCTEFLLVARLGQTSEVLPRGLYCSDLMDLTLASSILSLFQLLWCLRFPIIPSRLLMRSLSSKFSFRSASLSSFSSATYFSSSALRWTMGGSTASSLCLDCSISMSFSRRILTWLLSSQILDSYSEVLRDLKLLLRNGSLRSERGGSRVCPFIDIIQLYGIRWSFPSVQWKQCNLGASLRQLQQYNKIIPPMFGILSSYDRRSQSINERSRYSSTIASPEDQSLAQKVSKIALLNLKEHDLDICACEECIYSRQLNRKIRIGLDMSKNSSYRAHFDSKYKLPSGSDFKIDYDAIQKQKGNKSVVVENSSYGANYRKDSPYQKPEKQHPEDELKFVGPLKGLSAYGEQYPAFKNNASPYIKPLEVSVPNTLKMNLKSIYQTNFNGVVQPPTESGKIPDQLRGGQPWTGGSTYRQLFKGHNIKNTPIREGSSTSSRLQKNPSDPNYAHQYQTTYRNEYLLDGRKRCNRNGEAPSTNPLLQSLKQTLQS